MVWLLNAAIVAGVFHNRMAALLVVAAALARAVSARSATALAWVPLSACCVLVGHAGVASVRDDAAHVARVAAARGDAPVLLEGRVVSFPHASRFGTSFLFETSVEGRRVLLAARSPFHDVCYGDRMVTRARVRTAAGDDRLSSREASGSARMRLHDTVWLSHGASRAGAGQLAWRWHRALRVRLTRALADDAALPLALLLGERGFLEPRVREAVVRLGIAHLLALSGMHLAAVSWLALLLSRAFPRGRDLVLLALLSLYVAVVGDVGSLTRAYLMTALMLVSRALVRPVRPVDALAKALFLMLLVSPASIRAAGLQLSFAATLAVLAVVGRLPLLRSRAGWRPHPAGRAARWVAGALVVSVAVEVVIAPLQLHHFGRISVVGPLATALFLLPVTVLQVLAMVTGCALTWSPALALLGAVARATRWGVLAAASHAPPPVTHAAPAGLLYYGAVLLVWRFPRRPAAWAAGALLVAASFRLG